MVGSRRSTPPITSSSIKNSNNQKNNGNGYAPPSSSKNSGNMNGLTKRTTAATKNNNYSGTCSTANGKNAPGASVTTSGFRKILCFECYSPASEMLEYDYSYNNYDPHGSNGRRPPQSYPRIRERGEYYVDSFNDQAWSWTFGTAENVSTDYTIHIVDTFVETK